MDFEVCVDSYQGALIAHKYGAKRIELCSDLYSGGTTPSIALLKQCLNIPDLETHVMIRPRGGDFNYNENELLLMKDEITAIGELTADGAVYGILDNDANINIQANMFLMEEVDKYGLQSTFHRAIDVCKNPFESVNDIINIGFNRILTSGTCDSAIEGLIELTKFVKIAESKIEIMAGSGVNPQNALNLAESGIDALHFTARRETDTPYSLDMGMNYAVDEMKIKKIIEKFK